MTDVIHNCHDFSVHLKEALCVSVKLQHMLGAANGFGIFGKA